MEAAFSFQFIGKYGPVSKADHKHLMEFKDLAKLDTEPETGEDSELSDPKLAIMRMDVDFLGAIFKIGLQHPNYARIATLSNEFSLFFSGYFNVLAKKYQIYITYSGGDDAFVVGSWRNMIHFARELRQQFSLFTGHNPAVTFSAGIFLCEENFPVALAAKSASRLEGKAKDFKKGDQSKNAITVFGHTLTWQDFEVMMTFGKTLLDFTEEKATKDPNKIARSLVHRIYRLLEENLHADGNVDPRKLWRNFARLHYLFVRHNYPGDKIREAKEGIYKEILAVLLNAFSKEEILRDYKIPMNYVLMTTRKVKTRK